MYISDAASLPAPNAEQRMQTLRNALSRKFRFKSQFSPDNRTVAALEGSRGDSGGVGAKVEVVGELILDFGTGQRNSEYRQTARIVTNDPRQPTLTAMAQRTVTDLVKLEPCELVLSNVTVGEGA